MLKFKPLLISLVFCLATPVYAQMIFQDDFDNPGRSEHNWEVVSGVWEFKDGMLYSPNENTEFVTIYIATSEWDKDTANEYNEYSIEFKFMKESGAECCRPLWRAIADPLPKTSDERKGFYEWNIGGWTNTRAVLRRFEPDGQSTYLLDSQNNDQDMHLGATVEVDQWYHVKVIVRNNGKTEGYLDGQKSWEIEDNTWTDGRIGLVNWLANVFFDDFKVYGPAGPKNVAEPGNHLVTTWAKLKAP
ncbi:MAG: hypothetical protein H8D67_07980 [Deltaproteobacteria bacterium]|nr:hypothetical protein [Deltaproteobacteria bacterium]